MLYQRSSPHDCCTIHSCGTFHNQILARSSAMLPPFIRSASAAEHQPRVNDGRQPAARRRSACHDAHEGCRACELRCIVYQYMHSRLNYYHIDVLAKGQPRAASALIAESSEFEAVVSNVCSFHARTCQCCGCGRLFRMAPCRCSSVVVDLEHLLLVPVRSCS
jgi:hypothetical protein